MGESGCGRCCSCLRALRALRYRMTNAAARNMAAREPRTAAAISLLCSILVGLSRAGAALSAVGPERVPACGWQARIWMHNWGQLWAGRRHKKWLHK